jgi:hypothetical protein
MVISLTALAALSEKQGLRTANRQKSMPHRTISQEIFLRRNITIVVVGR